MRTNLVFLAEGYRLTGDETLAARAVMSLQEFFLDSETYMTPALSYAQAIPGVCDGRGIGIIDTLHLIDDLDNLHKQLLTLPVGEKYRALYAAVAPEIPTLKSKLGKQDISDVELFFRALYAVMLYRIKGDRSKENDIRNVIGLISPAVAELATVFHAVERGETDLFGPKK